jgi:phospholipase/lecithinase/hemolysin
MIPSVRHQVENYLADAGTADPEALYILHDGGNDSFLAMGLLATEGWDAAAAHMQTSAAGMVGSVDLLAANGAVSFVIPGAPLFSLSVAYCDNAMIDALGEVYNAELESGLAALGADLSIVYFDLFDFEDAISDHFITGCVAQCFTAEGACDNPEDFLLWDDVHLSEAAHQLIGDAIMVAMLKDRVLYLTMEGVLNGGNSNALLTKLDGACGKLEDREIVPAVNMIQAFANQVSAFVRTGKLSAEQAELLLVGANGIIDQP